MATPSSAEAVLTVGELVTVEVDLEPYVLQWSALPAEDGESEIFALVVLKKPGGILLALPHGVLTEEEVLRGNQGESGSLLGYSVEVNVPSVILDGGAVHATGESVTVLLADFSEEVVSWMRATRAFEEIGYNFDRDSPLALPEPSALLSAASEWIQSADPGGPLGFYTAEGSAEEAQTPRPAQAKQRAQRPRKAGPGGSSPPASDVPKQKRPTTASLAASMETMLQSLPNIQQQQLEVLSSRQKALESRMLTPVPATSHALRQPLSSVLEGPPLEPSVLAKQLPTPPRTLTKRSPGLLGSRRCRTWKRKSHSLLPLIKETLWPRLFWLSPKF